MNCFFPEFPLFEEKEFIVKKKNAVIIPCYSDKPETFIIQNRLLQNEAGIKLCRNTIAQYSLEQYSFQLTSRILVVLTCTHLNASEAFSSQVNNFSKMSQIMQIDEYKLQQFYHC